MKYLCSYPGCRTISDTPRCKNHPYKKPKRTNHKKPDFEYAADNSHIYNSQRWRNLRNAHIIKEPLCAHCLRYEIITPAVVVDHVIEISDDPSRAFDPTNLQSLCASCHQVKTLEEKKRRAKDTSTTDLIKKIQRRL
ncbi:TPA: HNH endonuclease [Aeromonas hydrophila subsp. hydrophila]|nr:HNH endonuclease [Aeromonas hydrophila subsp. hydrophila]